MKLIVGRAGAGKSHFIIEEIVKELQADPMGPPLYLIVPDQAAFYMESWLTRKAPNSALVRAQVLSFRRLAWRTRADILGQAVPPIRQAGKFSLIVSIYDRILEKLQLFGRKHPATGYMERLVKLIEECQISGVSPDDLKKASLSAKTDVLRKKAADLALLLESYQDEIAGRFIDPYDLLPFLAAHATTHRAMRDAKVWIDGFLGFTGQELMVIEGFMNAASDLTISIGAPKDILFQGVNGSLSLSTPFAQAQDTYVELMKICEKQFVKHSMIDLDEGQPKRFLFAPKLAAIERSLYAIVLAPENVDSTDQVTILSASSPRAEVAGIISQMLTLKREQRLKWSDFAIVTADLGTYEPLIQEEFTKCKIPYFMDERKSVKNHPLARIVLGLVELVATDFSGGPLWSMLKTDLLPVSRTIVDQLENFAISHGIDDFGMWRAVWSDQGSVHVPSHLQPALLVVRQLMEGPYASLRKENVPIDDAMSVLWQSLEDARVMANLSRMIDDARRDGKLDAADQHELALDATIQLFDEIVSAFHGTIMPMSKLARLLSYAYDTMKQGAIPATLDQVIVTETERVRAFEAEAVFVLGCVEGALPRRLAEDDLFTDAEREDLRGAGCNLTSPTARRQLFERYRVYMAMTRARKFLTLSHASGDEDGRALTPSSVVGQVRQVLSGVVREFRSDDELTGDDELDAAKIVSVDHAAILLATSLRKSRVTGNLSPLWTAVFEFFSQGEWNRLAGLRALTGLSHQAQSEQLPTSLALQLYGDAQLMSVSRLEQFAACSFAHFALYGLRLRPRERLVVDDRARGEFLHSVMHDLVHVMAKDGISWGELSDRDALAILDSVLEQKFPQFQDGIFTKSARLRHQARQVEANLRRAVLVLTEHARRSKFEPVATEIAFGYDDSLPAQQISLDQGRSILLRGRIDRVDRAVDEDGKWYRIIDYKSSQKELTLDKTYHGLSFQLPLYAMIVERYAAEILGEHHDFAGSFYFPITDPVSTVLNPTAEKLIQKSLREKLRMKGIIYEDARVVELLDARHNQDGELFGKILKKDGTFAKSALVADERHWRLLQRHIYTTIRDYGNRIYAGDSQVKPYKKGKESACAFCQLQSLCQFESTSGTGVFRNISPLKRDDVWALLESEVATHE